MSPWLLNTYFAAATLKFCLGYVLVIPHAADYSRSCSHGVMALETAPSSSFALNG